jgi:uncharacterized protein affecting Mg2+/Co2+ transport
VVFSSKCLLCQPCLLTKLIKRPHPHPIHPPAGHIQLNPENAVVGQQPIIPPGATFEYVSGSMIATPSGEMRGRLAVAELTGLRPWRQGDEWFKVAISAFQLKKPGPAGG